MTSIGQLKLPDNNNYNLSVPFVIGTGSTAGTWLGTLTGLTEYYDGLLILYKPSVAGASTTTLNLNSIGAKTCYINNTTKLTTHFPVNQPILLTYSESQNSGCWMCIDNYWTNNIPSAICTTAAATAAKVASCDYYTATANSYIHIVMRYANTSATALTLNIASKGAKPIYINGTASSASNYTLPAGTYLIFYDGTNYYFRTDGKLTADITGDAETVNGHTVEKDVPSDAVFTDTTYESKTAVSGGTALSLVTTGEKYNWNNKAISNLNDTTISSATHSDILTYNNGKWVNQNNIYIRDGNVLNITNVLSAYNSNGGRIDIYNSNGDSHTQTITITGSNGNIKCTTINGHNIPTTLSESETYSFNATTTLSYIGKNIVCSTGTKIVRAYFRYVHSAPVETAVVRSSTSLGSYYCDVIAYGKDTSSACLTFIIKAGETFYFWAKYSGNAQNNLDIHSVYISDN